MKYMWLIALLLLFFIGFEAAANFVAIILMAGIIFSLVAAMVMAISSLLKIQILEMLKWTIVAVFWGWILSICL